MCAHVSQWHRNDRQSIWGSLWWSSENKDPPLMKTQCQSVLVSVGRWVLGVSAAQLLSNVFMCAHEAADSITYHPELAMWCPVHTSLSLSLALARSLSSTLSSPLSSIPLSPSLQHSLPPPPLKQQQQQVTFKCSTWQNQIHNGFPEATIIGQMLSLISPSSTSALSRVLHYQRIQRWLVLLLLSKPPTWLTQTG